MRTTEIEKPLRKKEEGEKWVGRIRETEREKTHMHAIKSRARAKARAEPEKVIETDSMLVSPSCPGLHTG